MKSKIIILTNIGSNRINYVAEQLLQSIDANDIMFVITPAGKDLNIINLATKGLVDLFPQFKLTEKLYDPLKQQYRKGTLGCMLNHYLGCLEILKNGLEFAVLLEDNAKLNTDFSSLISNILSELKDSPWDIVHLWSNLDHERLKFSNSLSFGLNEWGTAKALLVSKRYASETVSRIPFYEVADGISMIPSLLWSKSNCKSFVATPYIAEKSDVFEPERIKQDSKSDNKFLGISESIFALDSVPWLYCIGEQNFTCNNPTSDGLGLFLTREAYFVIKINDKYSANKVDKLFLKNHGILEYPDINKLIIPFEVESYQEITSHTGLWLPFDKHTCIPLNSNNLNSFFVFRPVQHILPTNIINNHIKFQPKLLAIEKFAI